jgi:hypothetical protein
MMVNTVRELVRIRDSHIILDLAYTMVMFDLNNQLAHWKQQWIEPGKCQTWKTWKKTNSVVPAWNEYFVRWNN